MKENLTVIAKFLITLFLDPFILLMGWNVIAPAFNLPTFGYWGWFFICWALRVIGVSLFKSRLNKED